MTKTKSAATAAKPAAAPAPAPANLFDQALLDRAEQIKNALDQFGKQTNSDPYLARLDAWEQLSLLLAALGDTEKDLRLQLFAGAFPNPTEGTNSHKLPDGRVLKGQHKINRTIDEAALPAVLDSMKAAGVANFDKLVRYKPELSKSEWNTLSDENKVRFSPAVIARPGTPSFEITVPKKR